MSEPTPDPGPKPRLRLPVNRQRLIELGVVVFGVLIALGLENLVQEARLRGDAHALEQAFRADIFSAVQYAAERQVVAPCLVQTLSSLTEQALTADGSWDAAPAASQGTVVFVLPQPYRAPSRTWKTTSFDRALGTEAFKRIPRDRIDAYSRLFAQIERRREDSAAEYAAISNLAPLAFSQAGVNTEVRVELLASLSAIDRYRALALLQSDQIIDSALSLPGGEDIRAEIAASRTDVDELLEYLGANYGNCIDRGAFDRLINRAAGSYKAGFLG